MVIHNIRPVIDDHVIERMHAREPEELPHAVERRSDNAGAGALRELRVSRDVIPLTVRVGDGKRIRESRMLPQPPIDDPVDRLAQRPGFRIRGRARVDPLTYAPSPDAVLSMGSSLGRYVKSVRTSNKMGFTGAERDDAASGR